MRPRWSGLAGAAVTSVLAGVLAACAATDAPVAPRDPMVFGEIVRVEPDDNPDFFVHLRGGLRQEVHLTGSNAFGDAVPDVGELYLSGGLEEGGEPWYAFLPAAGDCWVITGPARRDGDRLHFVNSLRLRISPTVDWGAPGELAEYSDSRTRFCVDEMGLVAAYLGP